MWINDDVCYQALTARDARFDGQFFVAVVTTGVYCRPVCPARVPRRDNCRFFARHCPQRAQTPTNKRNCKRN
jgi:AraC family transcriptional regulator of adaptative response / DNA-3-methyladenine glycosylase II